jgi:hypothetical protein
VTRSNPRGGESIVEDHATADDRQPTAATAADETTEGLAAQAVIVWTSEDRCMAASIGTVLELDPDDPEAAEALASLPTFYHHPIAEREFDDLLAERFGVRLRQLAAPPRTPQRWIAVLATTHERDTHAVVAAADRVIHDPGRDQPGRRGQPLPARFGDRLLRGYVLERVTA